MRSCKTQGNISQPDLEAIKSWLLALCGQVRFLSYHHHHQGLPEAPSSEGQTRRSHCPWSSWHRWDKSLYPPGQEGSCRRDQEEPDSMSVTLVTPPPPPCLPEAPSSEGRLGPGKELPLPLEELAERGQVPLPTRTGRQLQEGSGGAHPAVTAWAQHWQRLAWHLQKLGLLASRKEAEQEHPSKAASEGGKGKCSTLGVILHWKLRWKGTRSPRRALWWVVSMKMLWSQQSKEIW